MTKRWFSEIFHGVDGAATIEPPWGAHNAAPFCEDIYVIYTGEFWEDPGDVDDYSAIDQNFITSLGTTIGNSNPPHVSSDLEAFTAESVATRSSQYAVMLGYIKDGLDAAGWSGVFSQYQWPPETFHYNNIFVDGPGSADWLQWQSDSSTWYSALSSILNAFAPKLYRVDEGAGVPGLNPDPPNYIPWAEAMISELKLLDSSWPIYPYLTWEYTNTSTAMETGLWLETLELCHRSADGAILWGGYQEDWGDDLTANNHWWEATTKFLEKSD